MSPSGTRVLLGASDAGGYDHDELELGRPLLHIKIDIRVSRLTLLYLLLALVIALAVVGITVGGTVILVTIAISSAILVVQVYFLIRQLMRRRSSVVG